MDVVGGVRGIGMVSSDFGKKSQQNWGVVGGFGSYEAGRGRIEFRL